jgi:hypothetical protein
VIPNIDVTGMSVHFYNAPFWDPSGAVSISGINIGISPDILKTHPYHLEGEINDVVFGKFSLEGNFGGARINGRVNHESLVLSKQMVEKLHPSLQTELKKIRLNDGNIELNVEFHADDVLDRIDYSASADLKNVSVSYRNWPIEVTEMYGKLHFENLRLESTDLKFNLAEAEVDVESAEVDLAPLEPEFTVKGVMKKLHIDDQFVESLEQVHVAPFADVAESLSALGAHGYVDVNFDLSQSSNDNVEGVKVDIIAQFREADLTFRGYKDSETGLREGYPYPLKKVVGTVHIGNNRLDFRDLTSSVREPDLRANGYVTYGEAPFSYDIDIKGYNVQLDEKVRGTLPIDEREIFDSYNPSGPVDFALRITRPVGREDSPDFSLDVNLRGCTAEPALFPYQLEDLRGHLLFGGAEGTLIKAITARHEGARFNVNGKLDHHVANDIDPVAYDPEVSVGEPTYDLEIAVEDLPVNEDLFKGIGREFPEIAAELRRYGFSGIVDFDCSIKSEQGGALNTYHAEMKGLDFCYERFSDAKCTNLKGEVIVEGDKLRFNRTTFQLFGNEMDANGWLNIGSDPGYDIRIGSKNFAVTKEAIDVALDVAPSISDISDETNLAGNISLGLLLRSGPQGELFQTNITAQGLSVDIPKYRIKARNVYGSVEIEGDDLNLHGWTGVLPYGDAGEKAQELVFSVNRGHLKINEEGSQLNLHDIGFDNLLLDSRLWKMLPEEIALEFDKLRLSGRVSGKIDSLLLANDTVRLSGQVNPRNVKLDPGVPLAINHGTVIIEDARFGPESFDVEGRLEDSDLVIDSFPVTSSAAIFQVDQDSFGLRNFEGDCLGGRVKPIQSHFTLNHGGDGTFASSLSVKNIDLSQFAITMGGNADDTIGNANGWAEMKGKLDDHSTFVGKGEIWIKGEKLYELPVLAKILHFVNFDFLIHGSGQEQRAHFTAKIENEKMLIEDARFEGPGIALDGGGHVGFDGVAQLEFTPTIIKLLDGIPVLGDIVNVVTGFLVSKIKVSGPMEDLRAEGDNYFTELLPSAKDTGRRLKTRPLKVDDRK